MRNIISCCGRWLISPVRRWNRSKTTTVTHNPLMLPVTSMHVLNDRQSLVCFSAGFGIAVRSLPATGSYRSLPQPSLVLKEWAQAKSSRVGSYPSILTLPVPCGLDHLYAPSCRKGALSSSHGVRCQERRFIPTFPKPWRPQIAVTGAPYAAMPASSTKVLSITSPGQLPRLQSMSISSLLVATAL